MGEQDLERKDFWGESFYMGIYRVGEMFFIYVPYAYNILLYYIKINIYLVYRNIVSWY